MASLVLQPSFADQFKGLNRIRLRSVIDSFLAQDRSIPLIVRLWLKCLKTRYVPLGFSKMMILSMLRARSSKLLALLGKDMEREMLKGADLMSKTRII